MLPSKVNHLQLNIHPLYDAITSESVNKEALDHYREAIYALKAAHTMLHNAQRSYDQAISDLGQASVVLGVDSSVKPIAVTRVLDALDYDFFTSNQLTEEYLCAQRERTLGHLLKELV